MKSLLLLYCTGYSNTEPTLLCCTVRYCTVLSCMCNLWGKILFKKVWDRPGAVMTYWIWDWKRQDWRQYEISSHTEWWRHGTLIPREIKNLKIVHTFKKAVTEHTDRTWWELPIKNMKMGESEEHIRRTILPFLTDPPWITGGIFLRFPLLTFSCAFLLRNVPH